MRDTAMHELILLIKHSDDDTPKTNCPKNTTFDPHLGPAPEALLVASRYALPGYGGTRGPGWPDHLCQVIAVYALRLNSPTGTDVLTMYSFKL